MHGWVCTCLGQGDGMIRAEFQAPYSHTISLTKNKEMDHIPEDQQDE